MRNNLLNGIEQAEDLKRLVSGHPSLTRIDLSNTDMNISKNKIKNAGAQALLMGILESGDYSVMSEINLSNTMLTHECLPYFGLLSDPDFI